MLDRTQKALSVWLERSDWSRRDFGTRRSSESFAWRLLDRTSDASQIQEATKELNNDPKRMKEAFVVCRIFGHLQRSGESVAAWWRKT